MRVAALPEGPGRTGAWGRGTAEDGPRDADSGAADAELFTEHDDISRGQLWVYFPLQS